MVFLPWYGIIPSCKIHAKMKNHYNYVKAVRLGEVSEKLDIMLQRLAADEKMNMEAEMGIVLQHLATAAYKARKAADGAASEG